VKIERIGFAGSVPIRRKLSGVKALVRVMRIAAINRFVLHRRKKCSASVEGIDLAVRVTCERHVCAVADDDLPLSCN
jgi:hypothetical protein